MMNWNTLLSAKRFGLEEYHQERHENRSEFQRDYDRLVFSAPFRRLQNKTQVFPLPGSIFVHNRLTHSLEVSCVGRSLGNDVAKGILRKQPELQQSFLPEIGSIVSAACLAHDLGNPPFGHSGEKAISTFFSEGKGLALKPQLTDSQWEDFTHFEGNANAFRLLTHQFEGRRPGGFVLTYSTLASIVKYPFSSSLAGQKQKFGFFISEEKSFRRIAEELGMTKLNEQPLKYARHPLVYLVEAADDICYQMMDIEDAHKLKILTTDETKGLLLSYFDDFTGSLMTERNRDQAERIPLKLMRVRTAYAAALNLNQNIIVADLRNRIFLQFKVLGLCQHRNPCGLGNPRSRRSRRFVSGHSRKYLSDNFFYIHRINVHLNSSFLLTDAQAV